MTLQANVLSHRFSLSLLQPTFLVELSKVLANPGNTQVARVAAGLQVKNSLTSKDPEVKAQYQQRWLAIDANARREIKNYVSPRPPSLPLRSAPPANPRPVSVRPAGSTDAGHGDVPAQLGVAVRRRYRLRGDSRQPVARTDPAAGSQRHGPVQHRAHEGVHAGGHRIHLSGHREWF